LPRLREIRRKFGTRVAHIVDGCTDSYAEPKPAWLERKKSYLGRIGRESAEVLLVSAADKLSNVRETMHDLRVHGETVFERFAGKKQGTLWYYGALVDEFRKTGSNPLFLELAQAVNELESLARAQVQLAEPARR